MIKLDNTMRSFHLEKTPRPVGRPKEKKSFRLCSDMKSFKLYKV